MLIFWISFLEDDIVFPKRILFLENLIDLVPSENHPRPEDKESKSNQKPQKSRIEEDSYPQDNTDNSEDEHRIWVMS